MRNAVLPVLVCTASLISTGCCLKRPTMDCGDGVCGVAPKDVGPPTPETKRVIKTDLTFTLYQEIDPGQIQERPDSMPAAAPKSANGCQAPKALGGGTVTKQYVIPFSVTTSMEQGAVQKSAVTRMLVQPQCAPNSPKRGPASDPNCQAPGVVALPNCQVPGVVTLPQTPEPAAIAEPASEVEVEARLIAPFPPTASSEALR